jgi:hypothetical protein
MVEGDRVPKLLVLASNICHEGQSFRTTHFSGRVTSEAMKWPALCDEDAAASMHVLGRTLDGNLRDESHINTHLMHNFCIIIM